MSRIVGNPAASTLAPQAFALQPGQVTTIRDLPFAQDFSTQFLSFAPDGGQWVLTPPTGSMASDPHVISTSVADGAFTGTTWKDSNHITSRGQFDHFQLPGLPGGSTELHGKWARIMGPQKLDGQFQITPIYRPSVAMPKGDAFKSDVTVDGFDMVTTYHALTTFLEYLVERGHDMEAILGSRRPVVANVNGVTDTNAWMDPTRRGGIDLTFGTALKSPGGEWHLASDKEIVWHELGHLILHCVNGALTSWYARDGGAIHEGFGDAMACLFSLDAQASEDFAMTLASEYGTLRGLRRIDNEKLQYKDTDPKSVHDRGRIYGTFSWFTMLALTSLFGGDERAAADLTAEILVQHGFEYATNRPGPKDFLEAVLIGAKTFMEGSGKYDLDVAAVEAIARKSAEERGMLAANLKKFGRRHVRISDVKKLLAAHKDRFAFLMADASMGTFGGRQFHQQYALIGDTHIRMLGSGLIYFTDTQDVVSAYSKSDFWPDATINPTIKVTPKQAFQAVLLKVKEVAEEKRREKEKLEREGTAEQAWRASISSGTFAKAAEEAEKAAGETVQVQVEVVVMPQGYSNAEKQDLHYRFALGGRAEFYVNAVTGEVAVREMPTW